MARTTLGDLHTRALRAAEIPADSTGRSRAVIDADELIDIGNDALAELHDILVSEYEDWLFEKNTEKATVANQDYTWLPDNHYKLRKLYLLDQNQRHELDRFNLDDLSEYSTTDTTDRPFYRVGGRRIWWHPLPSAAFDLEIWQIVQFAPLEKTTDEIHPVIPAGWEPFLVGHMAEYMLSKIERDPSAAIRKMERAKARIQNMSARNRDTGPMRFKDASGRYAKRRRYPQARI